MISVTPCLDDQLHITVGAVQCCSDCKCTKAYYWSGCSTALQEAVLLPNHSVVVVQAADSRIRFVYILSLFPWTVHSESSR